MKQETNKDKVVFRMNIREQRKDTDCCGGNGPNCKCSSNTNKSKNSMVEFFNSMKKNFEIK